MFQFIFFFVSFILLFQFNIISILIHIFFHAFFLFSFFNLIAAISYNMHLIWNFIISCGHTSAAHPSCRQASVSLDVYVVSPDEYSDSQPSVSQLLSRVTDFLQLLINRHISLSVDILDLLHHISPHLT